MATPLKPWEGRVGGGGGGGLGSGARKDGQNTPRPGTGGPSPPPAVPPRPANTLGESSHLHTMARKLQTSPPLMKGN